ncbi:hypothetical protein DUI87_30699 [Hirundo rustica rustica]|uniref:Uncharacterized protein n=1 Tax=Hirundo rustica rustica TaxID=333673 RepID=A0A3M0IVV7_HIRRU|nr:hypothetical protein DUI87_30699 [Hirundo rustica rustica]
MKEAPFQQRFPSPSVPSMAYCEFSPSYLPEIAFVLVEFNEVTPGPVPQPVYISFNGNPGLECIIEMEID